MICMYIGQMHTTFTIYWNLSSLALPLRGTLWARSLTDTLDDTHEIKRDAKGATRATTTTTTTMRAGDNKIQNHMGYMWYRWERR